MTDINRMFEAVDEKDFGFDFHPTGQRTKIVDYKKLIPFKKNRSLVSQRVSQLVESIKLHGKLLEDPIVTENHDGTYTILSGHHRLAAIKQLVEIEHLSEFSKLRVKIEEKNDLDNELTMIDCNLEREELSSFDKMMAIGRKEEILLEKKERKEIQYAGSTRSYIAASNQLKETQVGVYLRVYKKGSKPLKKALQENKLNITQAYDLAILDSNEQDEKLKDFLNPNKKLRNKNRQCDIFLEDLRSKIESKVQSKVILNKNTLSFKFSSIEVLNNLLELLHLNEIV